MKALTVQQPWAWAIAKGYKRIENRSWHPGKERGSRIAIHAGARRWQPWARAVATVKQNVGGAAYELDFDTLTYGAVIAVATIHGVVNTSIDPWFEGPRGWILHDVVELPTPVPCRGALNLWTLPPQVEAAVLAQLAAAGAASPPQP